MRVYNKKMSSCMVPPNIAHALVDNIREEVHIVTGTHTLGAPLVMDFSMSDGPPTSYNVNYVHSWLQDSAAAQQKKVGQNRGLVYIGLWKRAFGFSAHDYVCGTAVGLYALCPLP
jgi:hypothetical protein